MIAEHFLLGAGGALPARVVKRETKNWSWGEKGSGGWTSISSGPLPSGHSISVYSDAPENKAREVGAIASEALAMVTGVLGDEGKRVPFSLRVFFDARDFCAFSAMCGAPSAKAFYDPRTGEVAVSYQEGVNPDAIAKIVVHEFTHAYVDKIFDVMSPLWFAEGIAEYFGHYEVIPEGLIPGGVAESALRRARESSILLSYMASAGRATFYGQLYEELYAVGWLFTHFLMHEHPQVVDALLHKVPLIDIANYEPAYRAYLEAL